MPTKNLFLISTQIQFGNFKATWIFPINNAEIEYSKKLSGSFYAIAESNDWQKFLIEEFSLRIFNIIKKNFKSFDFKKGVFDLQKGEIPLDILNGKNKSQFPYTSKIKENIIFGGCKALLSYNVNANILDLIINEFDQCICVFKSDFGFNSEVNVSASPIKMILIGL